MRLSELVSKYAENRFLAFGAGLSAVEALNELFAWRDFHPRPSWWIVPNAFFAVLYVALVLAAWVRKRREKTIEIDFGKITCEDVGRFPGGGRTELWRTLSWQVGDDHADRIARILSAYAKVFGIPPSMLRQTSPGPR